MRRSEPIVSLAAARLDGYRGSPTGDERLACRRAGINSRMPRLGLPVERARERGVPVREVVVHGESLADVELVHHDEAQAGDEAVCLVPVASEVLEGGVLVVHRDLIDLAEGAVVEASADLDRLCVALRKVRGL